MKSLIAMTASYSPSAELSCNDTAYCHKSGNDTVYRYKTCNNRKKRCMKTAINLDPNTGATKGVILIPFQLRWEEGLKEVKCGDVGKC